MKKIIIIIILLFISFPAFAERKALLIGNKDYSIKPLRNPINDVMAMKKVLIKLGFEVTLKVNLNKNEMNAEIHHFTKMLKSDDLSLVYYSGHGTQAEGYNYLMPIGIGTISSASEVKEKSVELNYLLSSLEKSKSKNRVVILDSCRDNPFINLNRGLSRVSGMTHIIKRGGTLVAFAASPGGISEDGREQYGTYTKYLLKYISTEGISLSDMFTMVRKGVVLETNNKQRPIEENGLLDPIYLAGRQNKISSKNKQCETISNNMVWYKGDHKKPHLMKWKELNDYVKFINRNNKCGYNNWVIPSVKQLETLLVNKSTPRSDKTMFSHFLRPIWSSKEGVFVNLYNGVIGNYSTNTQLPVLLITDGDK